MSMHRNICMATCLGVFSGVVCAQAAEESVQFFESHPNAIDFKEEGDRLLFANRLVGLELRRTDAGFHLARLYGIVERQDYLTETVESRDIFELRMTLDPKYVGKDHASYPLFTTNSNPRKPTISAIGFSSSNL